MGPDGHIASLFPEHEALDVDGQPTVGVHGSPKPPPERVSLTYDAIRGAREVWVVAAGAEKAQAVASALRGAPVTTTPAAGAIGTERTLWLVDIAATEGLGTPAVLSTTAAAFPAPVDAAAELWSTVDEYFSVLVPEDVALVETRHAAASGGLPDIAVAANQGKLLHLLAQSVGARRILEIGTLGGYSTLWLARALPSDGRLTTLEIDPEHARVATDSLTQAGVDGLVDVLVGPAADTLDRLDRGRDRAVRPRVHRRGQAVDPPLPGADPRAHPPGVGGHRRQRRPRRRRRRAPTTRTSGCRASGPWSSCSRTTPGTTPRSSRRSAARATTASRSCASATEHPIAAHPRTTEGPRSGAGAFAVSVAQPPRLARSAASASSRIAAPSSSDRRSFT